jgi:hypothetical protein
MCCEEGEWIMFVDDIGVLCYDVGMVEDVKGVGLGVGLGVGVGLGDGAGEGAGVGDGVGDGLGVFIASVSAIGVAEGPAERFPALSYAYTA